jgi:hypothetical protein
VRLGVLAAAALAPTVIAACGGDGVDTPEDERARQISGVAELATNAYASAGAEGLYDYLASSVVSACSKQGLAQALADEPVPDGFKSIGEVTFDGSRATAKVTQVFGEEEREVEWSFALEENDSWRLTNVPGIEACES